MADLNRRLMVAGLIASGGAGAAGCAAAAAKDGPLKIGRAFPLLASYYDLAVAKRSHFKMGYTLSKKGVSIDKIAVSLVEKGKETQLHVDSMGFVSPLPGPEQLRGEATVVFTGPSGVAYRMSPVFMPVLPPSITVDAKNLSLAIAQVNAWLHKLTGPMAPMVPQITCLFIAGPSSAQVRLASGEVKSLPAGLDKMKMPGVGPGRVLFDAGRWPTAQSLSFDTVPAFWAIGPLVKK
ncbi:hypothetical protein AEAC466_13215 [Asticcacaulis sp. AC466]|uniref:hypothetical protein n=1 Tax=Asticcacaulis sp. AC466 TaxID=1282362 RepID=UPI0003C3DD87|nr:hypothetical protein [Asticcacaulis sp. AC466]ESQ83205.1 hypothetical protein AEAC466_13215 [Asticcacaulis sp. AC466]